jgi:hypothetical protein
LALLILQDPKEAREGEGHDQGRLMMAAEVLEGMPVHAAYDDKPWEMHAGVVVSAVVSARKRLVIEVDFEDGDTGTFEEDKVHRKDASTLNSDGQLEEGDRVVGHFPAGGSDKDGTWTAGFYKGRVIWTSVNNLLVEVRYGNGEQYVHRQTDGSVVLDRGSCFSASSLVEGESRICDGKGGSSDDEEGDEEDAKVDDADLPEDDAKRLVRPEHRHLLGSGSTLEANTTSGLFFDDLWLFTQLSSDSGRDLYPVTVVCLYDDGRGVVDVLVHGFYQHPKLQRGVRIAAVIHDESAFESTSFMSAERGGARVDSLGAPVLRVRQEYEEGVGWRWLLTLEGVDSTGAVYQSRADVYLEGEGFTVQRAVVSYFDCHSETLESYTTAKIFLVAHLLSKQIGKSIALATAVGKEATCPIGTIFRVRAPLVASDRPSEIWRAYERDRTQNGACAGQGLKLSAKNRNYASFGIPDEVWFVYGEEWATNGSGSQTNELRLALLEDCYNAIARSCGGEWDHPFGWEFTLLKYSGSYCVVGNLLWGALVFLDAELAAALATAVADGLASRDIKEGGSATTVRALVKEATVAGVVTMQPVCTDGERGFSFEKFAGLCSKLQEDAECRTPHRMYAVFTDMHMFTLGVGASGKPQVAEWKSRSVVDASIESLWEVCGVSPGCPIVSAIEMRVDPERLFAACAGCGTLLTRPPAAPSVITPPDQQRLCPACLQALTEAHVWSCLEALLLTVVAKGDEQKQQGGRKRRGGGGEQRQ